MEKKDGTKEDFGSGRPSPVSTTSTAMEHKPPPEPAHAWWKVAGASLLFFNIWGIPLTYGAFQSFYTLEYLEGTSASAISWIGTVESALLVALGPIAGPLYDLGYWRLLVLLGGFLTVFGMMMLSLSTEYYQILLSQGICVGVGCGLLYIPSLTLIGNMFSRNRSIAMGVITSGIALGGIVFTIVYLELIPQIGFAWTVRVIAFIALATFLIAGPMLLIGAPKTSGSVRSLFDRAALTDVPFLVFTVAQFFIFMGYIVPLFYIPTFAQVVLGASDRVALYLLVGAQGASLLGRLGSSIPAQYVGTIIPWSICCAVSGILCFAWIAITTLKSFIAFSILYGFFSGALIALPPGLFPKICPDPRKLGSRMGISWTATAVATLIGAPIAGAIVDLKSANLLGVQVWSGTMLIVGALTLLVLWALLFKRHRCLMI